MVAGPAAPVMNTASFGSCGSTSPTQFTGLLKFPSPDELSQSILAALRDGAVAHSERIATTAARFRNPEGRE